MKKLPIWVYKDPILFLACGFGSGLLPYAPGTWGTLVAIPIYVVMTLFSVPVYLILCGVLFAFGCWFCQRAEEILGEHDCGMVVWDEIVGFLLTMAGVPVHIGWVILGFLLFRLFDIIKPFPIRYVDKHVKGGVGVMLDDVLAAVFAWVVMQVVFFSGNS